MIRRLVAIAVLGGVLASAVYVFRFGWPEPLRPIMERLSLTTAQKKAAPTQPPPMIPEVEVITVEPKKEVPFPIVYAGRIAGFREVEVRAQVGGILLKREFDEGARVKKGQVLFRIDPAPFQAALDRAEAQLEQDRATLREAEENYTRIRQLQQRDFASRRQLDEATRVRDQAKAAVRAAEAEIRTAKLNLGYTVIEAPVAGVTALTSPPEGSLVQAQQTLLTSITQLDPAYVNFSFTNEEAQEFRRLNEQREKPLTEKDLTVELHFGDGTVYPHEGRIDTAAQRVDARTGTIQARAIFPNPDGTLLPGLFVRIVIRGVTLPNAIIIPEAAISQGAQGPFVFVVADENKAEVRPIRLGPELSQGRVVEEGLKADDRVITSGILRVRPGGTVKPVPAGPRPQGQTPPAGAPAGGPP